MKRHNLFDLYLKSMETQGWNAGVVALDIETGPHENIKSIISGLADKKKDKYEKEAGLNPLVSESILIGVTDVFGNHFPIHGGTHKERLEKLWSIPCFTNNNAQDIVIVGHNVQGFDLPFLVTSSIFEGVTPPAPFVANGKWGDRNLIICDSMLFLQQGNKQTNLPLDAVARRFGFSGKTGGHGEKFSEEWAVSENRPELINYNYIDNIQALQVCLNSGAIKSAIAAALSDFKKVKMYKNGTLPAQTICINTPSGTFSDGPDIVSTAPPTPRKTFPIINGGPSKEVSNKSSHAQSF